jgi:autotransporter-associated beta strand protein
MLSPKAPSFIARVEHNLAHQIRNSHHYPSIHHMKAKPALRNFLAALGCATLAISSASAQTNGTWTQPTTGTYNWSDVGNWLNDNVAGGIDATATFNVTPTNNQTINLDTAVTLGGLSLEWTNRSLTIAGPETLTLDTTSGIPTISVNSGRTLSINTVLAGSDGLLVQGGGRLTLRGLDNDNPNTLTGGVTVIGGIVEAFEQRANSIGDGPISLSEGGQLWLRGGNDSSSQVSIGTGGGSMRNRGGNTYETTGILTGSGTLTYLDAGGGGGRSLQFNSTDNDFTGGFVIGSNSQTIQVNSLVDSSNNIALNGTFNGRTGTFRYGADAITDLTLNERAFELNGSGSFTGRIDNANSDHAITINTNLIATGDGDKTLELSAASGPTNVFAGVIANATDGGSGTVSLQVSGGGTWELRGENTFTGNTTISAGTLTLADVSSMRFQIGDSELNNSILGSGTVNLDGELFFDLASASINVGDFWNIVDVDNLNESYGSTFSVNSTLGLFTGDSGIWTLEDSGTTWEFSESTGVLTVIPEPTTALLGGLGMLLLLRRRR